MRRTPQPTRWPGRLKLGLLALLTALGVLAGPAAVQASPEPDKEKVTFLGVAAMPADDTLRDQLKLGRGVGLSVEKVVPDSPAAKAGVKQHDILEKLDDQVLFNAAQLSALVRGFAPGRKVTLSLIRQGSRQNVEITLGETEASKSLMGIWDGGAGENLRFDTMLDQAVEKMIEVQLPGQDAGKPSTYLGVELAPVEAALATQLGLEQETGALVRTVLEESPAAKAGLKEHDVITKLDDQVVKDPAQVSTRIREHKKGDKVSLAVIRGGKPVAIEATLSERTAPEPARMEKLLQEHRVVPHVRILKGDAGSGAMVLHLDSDNGGDGARVEHRVVVRTGEPGEAGAGTVHVKTSGGGKTVQSKTEHRVIVVKTDQGTTTTVREEDGQRHVTVKDAQDKVIFDGPVNSAGEKQKLPAEVQEQIEKIEKDVQHDPFAPGEKVIRELRVAPDPGSPGVI